MGRDFDVGGNGDGDRLHPDRRDRFLNRPIRQVRLDRRPTSMRLKPVRRRRVNWPQPPEATIVELLFSAFQTAVIEAPTSLSAPVS